MTPSWGQDYLVILQEIEGHSTKLSAVLKNCNFVLLPFKNCCNSKAATIVDTAACIKSWIINKNRSLISWSNALPIELMKHFQDFLVAFEKQYLLQKYIYEMLIYMAQLKYQKWNVNRVTLNVKHESTTSTYPKNTDLRLGVLGKTIHNYKVA